LEIVYTDKALEDVKAWRLSGNKKMLEKISALIDEMKETPFSGTGKPEPLKHHLAGIWSRRITKEDRIVYSVNEKHLVIHSLKGHYE